MTAHHADVAVRRALLKVLLATLAVAAITGLVILFAGGGDVAGRVLGSVLVLAAGVLVALPLEFIPPRAARMLLLALVALDVVLVWVVIWSGDSPADWLVRVVGTVSALVVFVAVSAAVIRARRARATRWARAGMWVSLAAGLALLWMAWLMIWTDGDIGVPERVIAGMAIIWAASSLATGLIALLGGYTIVRREPPAT